MEHALLGFQARQPFNDKSSWSIQRRQEYLLVDAINYPLSVDVSVWPICQNTKFLLSTLSDYSTDTFDAPNGLNLYNIASDVSLNRCSENDLGVLIGVTVSRKNAPILRNQHSIKMCQYTIKDLENNRWKLLGFDVADSHMISALMNCGYSKEQKSELSKFFGKDINAFGLFNSEEIAEDFARQSELLVKEHAPFFVFGIWSQGSPNI